MCLNSLWFGPGFAAVGPVSAALKALDLLWNTSINQSVSGALDSTVMENEMGTDKNGGFSVTNLNKTMVARP